MRQSNAVVLLISLAAAGAASAGPDWLEHGDAGSTLDGAQRVIGVGQLETISGSLSSGVLGLDLEDMYLIRITEPSTFSFALNGNFDSSVWLFNVTLADEAFGLLANDNGPESTQPLLAGGATDGTMVMVSNPGIYAVAVSASGRLPRSIGGAIFGIEIPTEISGPDGPGGLLPHTSWGGNGAGGTYSITVTGINYVDVPSPGTGTALIIAGCVVGRRRRRAI